jgi:Zn-dependent protease with chaperone function
MIDAIYYDGNNSRRHPVTLVIAKRVVSMRGPGVHRNVRLSQMDVSERLQNAPRILRFPDGAFVEASDHRRLDRMLKENRFQDPRVVRWQNNWPLSLLALITLLATLLSLYQWGVPRAADHIAANLPPSLEQKMGEKSMALIESEMFSPSKLDPAVQARLRSRFAAMAQPRGEKTAYKLEFRASRIGANALALPNGVIVMTDDMVAQAASDDAVMGILGHELGHVKRHHSMRHVLQTVGVGLVLNLWVGDVSSALVAAPAILLNQKHSRDFEREADQYAIDMMQTNGVPLEPLAAMFQRMDQADRQKAARRRSGRQEVDEDGEPVPNYLSSHPSDAERVLKLRDADMRAKNAAATR